MSHPLRWGTIEHAAQRSFQAGSEVSDGPLEDGDLRRGIAGGFEFRTDLVLQIGGIADLVEQNIKEAFGGQQTVFLKLFDRLITDRNIGAADVENKIVMTVFSNPLES